MTSAGAEVELDRERRRTRLFLIAVLLHGLAYLCIATPWMGEDEPWHFEYASHVADGHLPTGGVPVRYGQGSAIDERRLFGPSVLQVRARRFGGVSYEQVEARQAEILASMRDADFFRKVDWAGAAPKRDDFDSIEPFFTAATQPPLYYVVLGAWLAPWTKLSLEAQLALARVLSLALYVATAWIALAFARRVFADSNLALCAAFCVAWLPMHARQAALVNNDVLARAWAALLLLIAARVLAREARIKELVVAGVVAALAVLTKATAAGAIVALVGAVGVSAVRRVSFAGSDRHARRRLVARVLASGALAACVAAFVLWRGRSSPVVPKNLAAFLQRVDSGLSGATLSETWSTSVGSFNWYSRELPRAAYIVAALVALLALLGVVHALVRGRAGISRAHVALCVAAVAAQLALVVLRGVGHGRYLMPAVVAFGPLVVVGLVAVWPERWRARAAVAVCTAMLGYDAYFLWGGLVPNEYLAWGS